MTSWPVVASSVLSPSPEPITKPPPWMCTITGRPADAFTPEGAQTLMNRQFSLPPAGNPGNCCAHSLPYAVACKVDDQGAGGCGGRQRRFPTGGAAYGIPSHSLTPLATVPQTGPSAVWTVVPDVQAATDGWAVADVAARTAAAVPSASANALTAIPGNRYRRGMDRIGPMAGSPFLATGQVRAGFAHQRRYHFGK